MATRLDFNLDQGATFEHELTWTTSDGTPIDLTGFVARMQVREQIGSEVIIFDLTTENSGIILGGSDGKITINIPADDSSNAIRTRGVYDLELVSPEGFVTRLVQGKVVIDPEVTV